MKLTGVKGEDELAMEIELNQKGIDYKPKRLFLYVQNLKNNTNQEFAWIPKKRNGELTGVKRGGWRGEMEDFEEEEDELAMEIEAKWKGCMRVYKKKDWFFLLRKKKEKKLKICFFVGL